MKKIEIYIKNLHKKLIKIIKSRKFVFFQSILNLVTRKLSGKLVHLSQLSAFTTVHTVAVRLCI